MFKVGQRVVVLRAYAGGANGTGTIVGLSNRREFPGFYKVELEGMVVYIEPDRLLDLEEFSKVQREEFLKNVRV
jgi:hypothetical protein